MANYVSGNIISQSYVHVDPEWLSTVSKKERAIRIAKIKEDITKFAETRIPFFIGSEIRIEVEFTDGSIKAKITSYGKIISLVGAFAVGYPSFSESVRTMVKDVHDVGSYVNSELLFQTQTKNKEERKSVEARLGVFGTLNRVNGKINELDRITSSGNCNPSIVYNDLMVLHIDILSSLDKISLDAIDDSDVKIAAAMWLDGINSIQLGRLQFKIQDKQDEFMYSQAVNERANILKNLKKCI